MKATLRRTALDLMGGRGIPPREAVGIVGWAERYHRLSSRSSSNPGPWRASKLPYCRGPLEEFTNPATGKITLVFASQCAKSTCMEIMLGYAADQAPYPAIWCFPGEKSKDAWAAERIKPTVDVSPRWQALLAPGKRSMTRAGINFISMPLFYALADSEADLASKAAGYIFADEIDKFPASTAREGSPLGQLRKRMRTFRFGKFVQSSTPTTFEGPIWQEYERSDKREWWVPCDGCGTEGPWRWENVMWEKRGEESDFDRYRKTGDAIIRGEAKVWYECPHCHHRHEGQLTKDRMNAAGRWVATAESVGHAGFHLPSMAAPFRSWNELAAEWLMAMDAQIRGDNRLVQEFVIHELARPYVPKRSRLEAVMIEEREMAIERGTVPAWAKVVTVGVDVQGSDNGIYWVALAWAPEGPRVHVVDWGHVPGRFAALSAECDELIRKRWPVDGGGEMLAGRIFWDSGDGMNTEFVYRYCARWSGQAVRPVKGEAALTGNAYVMTSKTAGDKNSRLLRVNVVALKDTWAAFMGRQAHSTEAVGFPRGASEDANFVSHLVSEERRISRSPRGQVSVAWVPRAGSGANHWWDALIYAVAGAAELKLLGTHRAPSRKGGGVRFGKRMELTRY